MKNNSLKGTLGMASIVVAMTLGASAVFAETDLGKELIINGETKIVTRAPAPSHIEGLDEVFFRLDFPQG